MASLSKDNQSIQFVGADGKRRTLRLRKLLGSKSGKATAKTAAAVKLKVEALNAAAISRTSWEPELAAWVAGVAQKQQALYDKLAAVKLVPPRETEPSVTLASFLDAYIEGRDDVKPLTKEHFRRVRDKLVAYFGADAPLATITPGDADEFRQSLAKTLHDNTVRRMCGRAKQFFRAAQRKRLISESPFGDMKATSVQANKDREHFVTRDVAVKVLEACPDVQWRCIFALARYGGLRCPSEVLALRWSDVLWDADKLVVRSPKTERHQGKGSRTIPLFPELRAVLDEAWEVAEPGAEFVITRYRQANINLRTQLERIIEKAGVEPWPKLFQNLRASRATELAAEHPAHVAAAWLGHSTLVAQKHYWTVTDDDFARATGGECSASSKALHEPTHSRAVGPRNAQSAKRKTPEIPEEYEGVRNQTKTKATPPGGELTQNTGEILVVEPKRCTNRRTAGPIQDSGPSPDAKLARVIDRWPTLPESVREAVLRLVDGDT